MVLPRTTYMLSQKRLIPWQKSVNLNTTLVNTNSDYCAVFLNTFLTCVCLHSLYFPKETQFHAPVFRRLSKVYWLTEKIQELFGETSQPIRYFKGFKSKKACCARRLTIIDHEQSLANYIKDTNYTT